MQNPYSICQLNICANIKYWLQILACLAARSPVHSPLNMLECCCFYIKLQLCLTLCICDFICPTAAHTRTHTHRLYMYIYICLRECVCFLLITGIIKISSLCIIADFSSVCPGAYLWTCFAWLGVQVACLKWTSLQHLHTHADFNMLQYSSLYSLVIINYIYCISIASFHAFCRISFAQPFAAQQLLHVLLPLLMFLNSALLARCESFLLTCGLMCSFAFKVTAFSLYFKSFVVD